MESLRRSAAISRVTSMALSAHEGALLVQGELGIGKSHLLDTVAGGVELTAVIIHINPAEQEFALSGISTILAGLRREGVTEFGGRFTLRSDDPDQMFAAAHDLIALIQGFALPPTLLLIDDIDRADTQTRSLIGIMASRLAGTGLRLVMTASAVPGDSSLAAIPTIRLSPLRIGDLIDLGERLAVDADVSTLRILAWFSGGNPRVLVEGLRLIDPAQLSGASWLTLPPRFNQALREIAAPKLTSLTADQLTILGSTSLAPLYHVAAIADAGLETADAIEDLVDVGVLRRQGPFVSFNDPRVRSYVHWSSDTHARRERHAALEQDHLPHSTAIAAWHRSFASYDKTGIDELLAGAAELVRLHRLDAAIELTERALHTSERIEEHVPAIIELCAQLLRAGDVTLAARYSTRVRPDAVEPMHALQLASFNLVAQMFQSQRIADDEVRALVGLHAQADPDGAAKLLMLAACFRAVRWETPEARHLIDGFPRLEDQIDPSTTRLLAAIRSALDALEGRQGAEPAPVPDLGDVSHRSPPELLIQGHRLTHQEQYEDARLLLNAVLNHPREVDHIWVDLARYSLITNEIDAGQFRRARAAIDSWSDDSPWFSPRSSLYLYIHAWHDASLGLVDDAAESIERCLHLASQEGSPAARARALALRGTLALMSVDPESAVVALRQVNGFAGRFRNPTMLRHWADYVEACRATGRHREAEAIVLALEHRLQSHRSRWGMLALARCRGLVATDEAAIPAFSAALELFGPKDSPYERGRTLLAMADQQDALGLPHEARRTRTMMAEAFDTAGAMGWSRQRPAAPADDEDENLLRLLSEEELSIARQVQDGMRNREIAESLYLSVRTVELRLTHIYRTLGVRSRSHLVAELARIEAPHANSQHGRSRA